VTAAPGLSWGTIRETVSSRAVECSTMNAAPVLGSDGATGEIALAAGR